MKKSNFNISLDLDGVIVDHTENIMEVARSLGFETTKKDSNTESLKKIMPGHLYDLLKQKIYGEMSLQAQPMDEAKSGIEKLYKSGHSLSVISRRDHDKDYALSWLRRQKIVEYIPEQRIVFVSEDKYKALEAKRFKSDIFLDDSIEVLFYLKNVSYPVLFNRFGSDFNSEEYEEVKSWSEFLEYVYKITLKESLQH